MQTQTAGFGLFTSTESLPFLRGILSTNVYFHPWVIWAALPLVAGCMCVAVACPLSTPCPCGLPQVQTGQEAPSLLSVAGVVCLEPRACWVLFLQPSALLQGPTPGWTPCPTHLGTGCGCPTAPFQHLAGPDLGPSFTLLLWAW